MFKMCLYQDSNCLKKPIKEFKKSNTINSIHPVNPIIGSGFLDNPSSKKSEKYENIRLIV